jgi:hypothetical protein
VVNELDNCPFRANPDQLGEACKIDEDNDGIQDFADNCPFIFNADQVDTDKDGMGDLCDLDMDGDSVLNEVDSCPTVANRDQADSDRDLLGDACDTSFCYVVNSMDNCLDPTAPFRVAASVDKVRPVTGDTVVLLLWANRANRGINYTWEVTKRPSGSDATIKHARGSVSLSTPYNYHYKTGRRVEFVPDVAGEYEVVVKANLSFDDDLYPGATRSEQKMMLSVGQGSDSGCQTAGHGGWMGMVGMLIGLVALRMRKR